MLDRDRLADFGTLCAAVALAGWRLAHLEEYDDRAAIEADKTQAEAEMRRAFEELIACPS